ncbi:DUF2637 domain-containing protein [Streptomyces profundus]|uniref:DUF2637 domain-containing protein n=1 Tax=Streptomyces profundus TaxID=2867410 RepID=UPI001D167366|nr:DUF2637 domain-containing protein [Streptomyces sp. MA3_2.13]UED85829.1 DUF2637 domain-containing protein [Streptomyces sp. MA3_2.13]
MTEQTAERYTLVAAATVIVALTAGAFWLSYAHLAEVAGQHGLEHSPVRQWAWPATLDAFIVAGELLMLRAGLRRVTDGWAIALTATGSIGSIALNVAGVSSTGNADAVPLLDYVVAAVPPTAALLAFGVLMRQIHQLVAEPTSATDCHNCVGHRHNDTDGAQPAALDGDDQGQSELPVRHVARAGGHLPKQRQPSAQSASQKPRTVSDELLALARTAPLGRGGRASRRHIEAAIRAKELPISRADAETLKDILQAELDANALRPSARSGQASPAGRQTEVTPHHERATGEPPHA